jgi:hypothetical protein
LVEECEKAWICVKKSTLDAVDTVHGVADDGDGIQIRKIRCFNGNGLIDDVDYGLEFRYIVVMDVRKKEGCGDDFPHARATNEENGGASASATISLGSIGKAEQMRLGWRCWNKRRRRWGLGRWLSLASVENRRPSKDIVELRDE